jgi:hypothetical protein
MAAYFQYGCDKATLMVGAVAADTHLIGIGRATIK